MIYEYWMPFGIGGKDKDLTDRFLDKKDAVNMQLRYYLARLQSMFKYDNLPDTIPKRSLELYAMCNGYVGFAEHKGDLYAFRGGLGGKPNPYYMPTEFIVANPALEFSKVYEIDKDCVIMPNDSSYTGVLPLLVRYLYQMTETEISLHVASINSRIMSLITADDDSAKASAELYLSNITKGKLGTVMGSTFTEGVQTQPYSTSVNNNITHLIELWQYQKASLYNDLGINANFNMKREAINSAESQLNMDALYPFVDDMLNNRKIAVDKVNKMFGTNISVDFDSAWEHNQVELRAAQDQLAEEDIDTIQTDISREESEDSNVD